MALAGCGPFPVHLDPLSVNGRDGGGAPPSYAALMRIGKAARDGGDYSNAVAVFGGPRRSSPACPVRSSRWRHAVGARRRQRGILAYNSALARDSDCLPALKGLAKAYTETGRPNWH